MYHEVQGATAGAVGTVLIVVLVAALGGQGLRFRVGPCAPEESCPSIMGIEARSWGTWVFLSMTLIIKEGLLAYGYTTYRFWITNEVMDRKATGYVGHRTTTVISMVVAWKVFQYVAGVVDINVAMAGDVQYMAMLWLTETSVYVATTVRALRQKQPRGTTLIPLASLDGTEQHGSEMV